MESSHYSIIWEGQSVGMDTSSNSHKITHYEPTTSTMRSTSYNKTSDDNDKDCSTTVPCHHETGNEYSVELASLPSVSFADTVQQQMQRSHQDGSTSCKVQLQERGMGQVGQRQLRDCVLARGPIHVPPPYDMRKNADDLMEELRTTSPNSFVNMQAAAAPDSYLEMNKENMMQILEDAETFFEDFDFPNDIGPEIEDDEIFGDLLEQMIA